MFGVLAVCGIRSQRSAKIPTDLRNFPLREWEEVLRRTLVIGERRKSGREEVPELLRGGHPLASLLNQRQKFLLGILLIKKAILTMFESDAKEAVATVHAVIAVPKVVRVPAADTEENVGGITNGDAAIDSIAFGESDRVTVDDVLSTAVRFVEAGLGVSRIKTIHGISAVVEMLTTDVLALQVVLSAV